MWYASNSDPKVSPLSPYANSAITLPNHRYRPKRSPLSPYDITTLPPSPSTTTHNTFSAATLHNLRHHPTTNLAPTRQKLNARRIRRRGPSLLSGLEHPDPAGLLEQRCREHQPPAAALHRAPPRHHRRLLAAPGRGWQAFPRESPRRRGSFSLLSSFFFFLR